MTDGDIPRFTRTWADAHGLFGQTISASAIGLAASLLEHLPLADVDHAIGDHLRDPADGRRPPCPADIIARIVGRGYVLANAYGRPKEETPLPTGQAGKGQPSPWPTEEPDV